MSEQASEWVSVYIYIHVHVCVYCTLYLHPPLDIPASGTLHSLLPVSYTIHNRTQLVQEVEARISTSDAFMYSGKRHVR